MNNYAIILPLLFLLFLFYRFGPKLKTYLNYRKALPNEAAVLKDLGYTAYSQYEQQLEPHHWKTLETSLKNDDMWSTLMETSTSFICENNNTIVGMAFLIPSGHPTEIYPADTSYIRMLGVHPDYKGKGIGKKLTQRCIEEAKALGETKIMLHTSEMMPAAIHIYEGFGFKVSSEIAPRFGKKYWLYKLDL